MTVPQQSFDPFEADVSAPELKDLVYTAAQVARILKIRLDTVYALLREGKLDATKISTRNYRISRAALLRFINGKTPPG